MVKSLSEDLRERVIAAVEAGASRRQAAARFGVSASSAVRWMQAWLQQDRIAPQRQGGDRRSAHVEGHADFLLAQIEKTPDLTIVEIQALLKERGVTVSYGSLWRFFDRHQITFKKKRRTPLNRSGLT